MKERVNFRLNAELLAQANERAKETGNTLTGIIEVALSLFLNVKGKEKEIKATKPDPIIKPTQDTSGAFGKPIPIERSQYAAQKNLELNTFKRKPTGYIFNIDGNILYIQHNKQPFIFKECMYNFEGETGICTDKILEPFE